MGECGPLFFQPLVILVGLGFRFISNIVRDEKSSQTSLNLVESFSSFYLQNPMIGVEAFPDNVLEKHVTSELTIVVKEPVLECLHNPQNTNPCWRRTSRWYDFSKSQYFS